MLGPLLSGLAVLWIIVIVVVHWEYKTTGSQKDKEIMEEFHKSLRKESSHGK